MTKNNTNQNCQYMARRIGSITYKVKVVFPDDVAETRSSIRKNTWRVMPPNTCTETVSTKPMTDGCAAISSAPYGIG